MEQSASHADYKGRTTDWIMDSGTSMMITNDRNNFWEYEPYKTPIVFKTAGTATIAALGEGTIKGFCTVNGKRVFTTLNNVAYIPNASGRLFSTGCIEHMDYCLIQGSGRMVIYDRPFLHGQGTQSIGTAIMEARFIPTNNLYIMFLEVLNKPSMNTVSSSNYHLWHRHLGHPSKEALK